MAPDASFVVAACNAEKTIGNAIERALSQTGGSADVILDDDTSDWIAAVAVPDKASRMMRWCEAASNGSRSISPQVQKWAKLKQYEAR